MGLKRRTFLQQAGLTLAALGVSETVLSLLGEKSLAMPLLDRYFQVLAEPSGRKLALLVGINQYPRGTALAGCVTDVELQRELLIHRFGFKASDILTLTDGQATRENIETAFIEHLTEQAQVGDAVVFHFSGYGSRVKLSEASQTDNELRLSNSLVPIDGILPTKGTPVANELLEETLILLLRSLATDRVTTVMDTSHRAAGLGLQGTLKVRSCPNPPAESPNPDELAFQEQLLLRLKSDRVQINKQTSLNQLPGVVLTAAGPSEIATEVQWNGFSAGLFTYALTQHLWQAAPATTVQITLSRTAGTVNQLVGKEQQPRVISKKSLEVPLLTYYLPPDPSIGADGVVTEVEENGKSAQLWLAGLPATVLEYYGNNSLLEVVVASGKITDNSQLTSGTPVLLSEKSLQLQMRSKEGLTAKGRLVGLSLADNYQLQVGQLVQEAIRVLPRNLGLTIALDSHLERIERVDATSAFASIPAVSSVVVAGEQAADYLFGKLQEESRDKVEEAKAEDQETLTSTLKADFSGGYGLFYLAREPIRNTAGDVFEAVKSAVNRLTPQLKTLLAAKLLRLTANEGSSRLGIRASLEMLAPQTTVVMQRETQRASLKSRVVTDKTIDAQFLNSVGPLSVPTLPIGSRVRYRLENHSNAKVYFMLLGIDPSSSAIALYKTQSSQQVQLSENKLSFQEAVIEPGETVTIPQSATADYWTVLGPSGLSEIQLICSREPLTKAIATLEASRPPKGEGEQFGDVFNPLDVVQSLLQDLHQASAVPPDSISTVSDTYALDVNTWATLSFIYQVV